MKPHEGGKRSGNCVPERKTHDSCSYSVIRRLLPAPRKIQIDSRVRVSAGFSQRGQFLQTQDRRLRRARRRVRKENERSLRELYRTLKQDGDNPLRDPHEGLNRSDGTAFQHETSPKGPLLPTATCGQF